MKSASRKPQPKRKYFKSRGFSRLFCFSWEQRKLGELVDVCSGRDYKHLSEGTIPVYGTGGYMLSVNDALSYDRDAIGIGRKGTIDRPYILKAPFWTVDTLFYAIPREKVDLNYAFDIFQNIDWKKKDESTGVPSLSKTAINDIDVLAPKHDEQQIIGQFFAAIDHLITLHQRDSIMRFFGAWDNANAWEQRKFDEVFDCTVPNNTLSRAELSYDEGIVLNVHYGDVLIKYGSVLDVQKDDIPRIPHRCRADFNGALLQDGDVIIADTAEDETTGKACEIGNLQGSAIVSGLHTMVCRPRNRMALGYLGYYLNSNAYHHQLLPLMQGIKVLSLSRSNIQKTSVSYPMAVKEQQLIAHYFSQLDNLITLHQREYAKLVNIKASMLEKMFPKDGSAYPEVRFAGFTDAWEQRKFDEVFDCTVPNNTLSRAELSYDEGIVLNVHYGDVLIKYGSVLDVQKDDIPRIPHRCRADFNGALLQDGDVIIADTAEDETTGKACEIGNLQGSAIVSGLHTMVCRPRNRMALGYLGYYLNSNAYHHQLLPLMQGIKVLSLSRSNIQKTSVSYPMAVKEQQLIAHYFSQLDNLITLHQRERKNRLFGGKNVKQYNFSRLVLQLLRAMDSRLQRRGSSQGDYG